MFTTALSVIASIYKQKHPSIQDFHKLSKFSPWKNDESLKGVKIKTIIWTNIESSEDINLNEIAKQLSVI